MEEMWKALKECEWNNVRGSSEEQKECERYRKNVRGTGEMWKEKVEYDRNR